MRKSKMWRMLTVAAVAASMTCGVFGVQSVSAADKKTLKVAMECGYAPYNWTQPDDSNGAVQISGCVQLYGAYPHSIATFRVFLSSALTLCTPTIPQVMDAATAATVTIFHILLFLIFVSS